ncbi:MAG TPA: VOC family protein [Steroidobacteraceae bacterium]|jgi:catechol 2,3-dioxygenase-like lactoylglutathione lyase family enzyme|nr:VOC family protein [Steroidobacteraceae bacterium]
MPSIGYATVGSNRLEEAKKFYDELFGSVGGTGVFEHPSGGRLYGVGGVPLFGVLGPFNKQPATAGNGTMIAFKFDSQDQVKAFYDKALALGGTDEGAPGERGPSMFFAYFRDLEGNKLCAYCFG